MRSPIVWFGGKGMFMKKLLPHVPEHKIFVEVFGGGASLLFAKKPALIEVLNDIDGGLINFYRVIRNRETFEEFYRLACLMPISREEYIYNVKNWNKTEDPIEKAWRWFYVARLSFSGNFGKSWSYAITKSHRNMAATCSKYLSIIELLPEIHFRLMAVQIEHKSFMDILPQYDTPETFFYLDPPYLPETRKDGKYEYEMSYPEHEELLSLLLSGKLKGKFILSGYINNLYCSLESANWKRFDFETSCHAVGRTRITGIQGKGKAEEHHKRIESLWLSPSCKPYIQSEIF